MTFCFSSVNVSKTQNTTMFLACVANVSDGVITQKSRRSGRREEETLVLPTLPPPSLSPSISPSISPSVESLLSYFVDELARKRLLRKLRCSDLLSRLMAYLPSKTQLY